MHDDLIRAKSIDIEYFLGKNGIRPKRENAGRSYYLSPFRDEISPSFVVYRSENRFYDWGEGWGGDVIDIAQRMWGCTTSEAINKLLNSDDIPQYFKEPSVINREPAIDAIEERENITNQALIDYMENVRKIPLSIVNEYCIELSFQFHSSRHVIRNGVAMKNDLGGYAVRSLWFKGAVPPSGVKTIKTTDTDECYLFEGFIDFLSYVVMFGEPEHTTVILNSTVFVHMMLDILQGLDKVHCLVDNDSAGNKAIDEMLSSNVNVIDRRDIFADYNDLNAKLQSEN